MFVAGDLTVRGVIQQGTGNDALAMDDAYDEVEAAVKLRSGVSLVHPAT